MIVVDGFSVTLTMIFMVTGLVVTALSVDYMRRMKIEKGELYSLMFFSVCGMILLAQINDLITLFLGLELLSIPLYVMAGFARPRLDSEEAALKYFFTGAFASGFLLYGIALVFGATGTTNIPEILHRVSADALFNPTLMLLGAGFLLVGFGIQGCFGSLPYVGAGCLPGIAHAGDYIHVGGGEDRRLRRADPRVPGGFHHLCRGSHRGFHGSLAGHHARRESDGRFPEEHQDG